MNDMKKIYIIMTLVLTGTMALAQTSAWNGGRQIWTRGAGTEDDPYLLESADHLACLAYMVNKGYETEGMYFRLTTDVDLQGSISQQWIPIGLGDRWFNDDGCDRGKQTGLATNLHTIFRGHFDGGDHYISNIYIDNSEKTYGSSVGLFGNVEGKKEGQVVYPAVIENVFLLNGYIKGDCCGGIVGNGSSAATTLVSRCWNGATIEGINAGTQNGCGGIIGANAYQVINCYNKGEIKGYNVGGIVGCGKAAIEECYNEGSISGVFAGGIYGYSLSQKTTINNCYNTGNVNAEGTATNAQSGPAAGGIAGFLMRGNSSVTNCYNVGEITSTNLAGCIVGYNTVTIENCYFVNTCVGGEEGTPQSEDEMRTQEFVDQLNGINPDPVWGMDVNSHNNGFPILLNNALAVAETSKTALKVYPNPAHGRFTVEGKGLVTVRNIFGQTFLTREIDGQIAMELPRGMYFVSLGDATRKIVVE